MTSSLLGIIPASGSGVRARPYSYEMHKGMFSIDGESNISRLISLMRDQFDIEEIVITLGYMGDSILTMLKTSISIRAGHGQCCLPSPILPGVTRV